MLLRGAAARSPALVRWQATCHTLNTRGQTSALGFLNLGKHYSTMMVLLRVAGHLSPKGKEPSQPCCHLCSLASEGQVTKSAQLPNLPHTLSVHLGFPVSMLVLRKGS